MLHMSFRHIGLGLTFRAAFTRFAAFGTFWVLATLAGFAAFGRLRKFYVR